MERRTLTAGFLIGAVLVTGYLLYLVSKGLPFQRGTIFQRTRQELTIKGMDLAHTRRNS